MRVEMVELVHATYTLEALSWTLTLDPIDAMKESKHKAKCSR